MGQRIVKPGPSAGCAAGQHIAISGSRVCGGRSLGPAENTELHHTIQQAHTLIMGAMFLRLVLLNIGQGEIGRDSGHGSRPFAR